MRRYPVNTEGDQISLRRLVIEASVVLRIRAAAWGGGNDAHGIGNSIEALANAKRGAWLAKGRIGGAERGGQRRSEIQTTGNVAALGCRKADLCTGLRCEPRGERSLSRKGKHLSGYAARRSRALQELRRFEPSDRRSYRRVAQRLVGEEGEQLVLQNGSAYAAAFLIEPVVVAPYRGRISGTVPPLVGIQARAVPLEECRAVELVRAVLRDDHDLRAAIPAVLGTVVAGDNPDFFYGLLVGREHGRPAPRHAIDAHAIDLDEVRIRACAIGGDLGSVLDEEDAVGRAGRRPIGAGHGGRPAVPRLCSIAKDPRREPYQLEGIATHGRQIFDVSRGEGSADRRRLRVKERD